MSKKRSKILIVDDDPLNVLILDEILGKDYDLLKASNADEAISYASEFRPDLILLDIMMPGSNGYEVCRKLRTNQYLQLTKIILVSSKSMLKDRLEGYKAGADDYISKPFDTDELLAKVKIFIRLKSVEEIDRTKDDIINLFSHETKTPMHTVLGFAKFLSESPTLGPDEKECANLIIENASNLLGMIEKTILLSSLRKESYELKTAVVTPEEVASAAIDSKKKEFEAKNLKNVKDAVFNKPFSIDADLVGTALGFILENAIKFSPEESTITVKSSKNDYGGLSISISDEGPGIPKERLDTLFDEFGVQDISHHGRGHGLSLSIVKYIMELHSGRVMASNNTNGKGATIELLFPKETLASAKEKTADSGH